MGTSGNREKSAAPPYTSFRTFLNLLQRMEEEGGVPSHVDRSYLHKLSGGVQNQLLVALRWLDLIGAGGEVQPELRELALQGDERPKLVGEMIRRRYPEVVELGERNGTQAKLIELFREMGATGATLRKSITFYLKAAEFSGIKSSPFFKAPSDPAAETVRKRRTAGVAEPVAEEVDHEKKGEPKVPEDERRQPPPPNWHPAIVGLLNELPSQGARLSRARLDEFLAALGAVLTFVYRVEEEVATPE